MAHKKSAGTSKNGRDSNPKYLGVKLTHGEKVKSGNIIIRQRGTDILAGNSVGMGKDHTLYALKDGVVNFGKKRKVRYDGKEVIKKIIHIN